jgi:hypothetical protein
MTYVKQNIIRPFFESIVWGCQKNHLTKSTCHCINSAMIATRYYYGRHNSKGLNKVKF